MKQKVKTSPDLSLSSPIHMQAITDGDEHFRQWQHNVIDKFKLLSNEEVRNELQQTTFPYAVCFENWISDFNISSGFRNANAFNAREMFYIGNKKFDRRGMCGVHNYMNIHWIPNIDEFVALKSKYRSVIGVDNIEGSISLDLHQWEENTIMIFGSESVGLTPTIQKLCDKLVYIPQFGSVRSLNAATASGIIMHDFVTKFRNDQVLLD